MTRETVGTRRRYSKDVKALVVAECEVPGASVAKVAMSHGINANLVHGWRKLARQGTGSVVNKPGEFIAVTVAPTPLPAPVSAATERDIEIELRRGTVTMKISWPVSAVADLSAWTRELLR